MDLVIVALVTVIIAGLWIAAVSAVVSAVKAPHSAWRSTGRTRAGTVAMIVVTGGVGGAYYWLRIRPDLHMRSASGAQPPEPTKAELRAIDAHRSLGT